MTDATIHIYGPYSQLKGSYPVAVVKQATSYPVEGAFFSKAYKQGRWDGRKHLFNARTGAFPTGLLKVVQEALEGQEIAVTIEDHRDIPTPSKAGFDLQGVSFEYPYDYQLAACQTMVKEKQGIVKIATGGGKTELSCAVTQYLGLPTLFVVSTQELMYQGRKRFMKRLGLGENEVGIIGDDIWEPGSLVTVAMLPTLAARMSTPACQSLLKSIDVLFIDECHHAGAESWFALSTLCPAYYRYGLSVGRRSMVSWKAEGKEYYTTIEELAHRYGLTGAGMVTPASDVQVLSFDGDSFVWAKLDSVIAHHLGEKQLFKVKTSYNKTLLVTEDHSVMRVVRGRLDADEYARTGHKSFVPHIEACRGADLQVGDYLLTPDMPEHSEGVRTLDLAQCAQGLNISVTPETVKLKYSKAGAVPRYIDVEDFSVLLGLFLGDGWLDTNRVSLSVHEAQVDEFLTALSPLTNTLNITPSISRRDATKAVEIRLGSKLLHSVFVSLGLENCSASNKRIPEAVWSWDYSAFLKLIDGLVMSDGSLSCRGNKQRVVYNTVSRLLALDVVHLLRKVGIVAGVSRAAPKEGGVDHTGKQIQGRHTRFFVGWSAHGSSSGGYCGSGRYPLELSKGYFSGLPVKIKEISPVLSSPSELVYDLCVDASPMFVANGLLVHNSGTPLDRTDGANLRLIAATGEVIINLPNKFLVDRGVSARANIIFDKVTEPVLKKKGIRYNTAYKQGVTENPQLLNKIVSWARDFRAAGLNTLILCEEIAHGRLIDDALWTHEALGGVFIPHQFIYGDESTEVRQNALDQFAKGEMPVLIASTILDEGIDVPTIDALILAGSRKSRIRTMQRLGRGLRGDKLIVVEFANFCHKYLLEHSLKRLQDYKSEECFPIHHSEPNPDLIDRIWNGNSS